MVEVRLLGIEERNVSEGFPTPNAAAVGYHDPNAAAAAAALATSLTTLGYAMFALMVPGPLENIQPITTADDHLRSQPTQQPQVAPEPEAVIVYAEDPAPVEYVVNEPIPLPVEMDVAPEPIVPAAVAPPNEAVAPAPLPVAPVPVSAAVANQFGEVDTVVAAAPEPLPVAVEPEPAPPQQATGRVNKSTLTMLQEISFLDE